MGEPVLYCHTCDIARQDTAGFVTKKSNIILILKNPKS